MDDALMGLMEHWFAGLVRSPLLCACSAYNLQENLRRALGARVIVSPGTSILQGATCCTFDVRLGDGTAR